MKKTKQVNKNPTKLSSEQAALFVEDFRKVVFGRDEPTTPISLRVPKNILHTFKRLAAENGQKYQSVIVRLMRDWVSSNGKN